MSPQWSHAATDDGQEFVFRESGEGPLVVLLHGFPDTPHGWERIADALADAGYRAVRPWLRGYKRETVVEGRPYDGFTIGADAIALLDALGERKAVLVGHDWGAAIAYSAASIDPGRIRAIVPIAIPYPSLFPRSMALVWAARHFIALRMPWAERRVRWGNFRYLDKLYRRWSPTWDGPEREQSLARAKECFADPQSLSGALSYYRAFSRQQLAELPDPPAVTGLVVGGSIDLDPSLYGKTAAALGPGSEGLVLEGAGHWPHRESEEAFINALITFLRAIDERPA